MQGFQNEIRLGEALVDNATAPHKVHLSVQIKMEQLAGLSDSETLKSQLAQKDEQIRQNNNQIAALLRIIETQMPSKPHAFGLLTQEIPNAATSGCATIQTMLSEEDIRAANRRIEELEFCIEMDFPQACVLASLLEPWIGAKRTRLLRYMVAQIYHQLARVEFMKARRDPENAAVSKTRVESLLARSREYAT